MVSINKNKFAHHVSLIGAVDNLRTSTHMPVWDDLEAIISNAKKQIQQQMPADIFSAAWNEGAKMNIDKMIVFAMEG